MEMYRVRFVSSAPEDLQNYSLMHFGIKGQRWGIRRFQNEDGSLTAEGKERYDVGDPSSLQRKMKNAHWLYKQTPKYSKNSKQYYLKYLKAKTDYENSKILSELNKKNKFSKHTQALQDKYVKSGMSKKDAAIAAARRIKTERLLAVAGAVTIAAASAYMIKNRSASIDKFIPKGTTLQNLSTDTNKGVSDAFYASYKNTDNKRYLSLFGGGHLQKEGRADVIKLTAKASENMKVAGVKASRDIAQKLINDDKDYKEALLNQVDRIANGQENNFVVRRVLEKVMPGINNARLAAEGKAKLSKKGYRAINQLLVDHNENGEKMSSKLYEALKKNGYDAVLDTNDVFNSGYDAKAPIIVFNGREKLTELSRTVISPETLTSGKNKELAKVYLRQLGKKTLPRVAMSVAATKAYKNKVVKTSYEKTLIRRYKKEHPLTTLSDKEILDVLV